MDAKSSLKYWRFTVIVDYLMDSDSKCKKILQRVAFEH